MTIKDTLTGGRVFNLPRLLIPLIVLIGAVYLFPNGIEPRIQRELNLISIMVLGVGVFVGLRLSISIGSLISYLGILCFIYPYYSPEAMIYFMFAIFFIFIATTYEYWKEKIDYLYDVICFVALINVLWEILQFFNVYILIFPQNGGNIITGLMSNPNEISVLLAICLPAFFRKYRFYLIPFVFLGLWLAGSMSGWFASVLVLGVYLIRGWKGGIIIAIGFFIIISIFAIYRDNFKLETQKSVRLNIYKSIFELAMQEPLGYGLGQFKNIFPLATSYKYLTDNDKKILVSRVVNRTKLNHALTIISGGDIEYFKKNNSVFQSCYFQAHNEYLEFWFEAGIFGLLLMLYVLLVYLVNNWKRNICFYGILASGITSLFFFTWHIIPMAVIMVLYLGIATGEQNGNFRVV